MQGQQVELEAVSDLYEQQCAAEQIQFLGGVQPHGFVLVIDPETGVIVQVSAGVLRHWPGIDSIDRLLGSRIDDWIDPQQVPSKALLNTLVCHSISPINLHLRSLASEDLASASPTTRCIDFESIGHLSGRHAVLEFLPITDRESSLIMESEQLRRLNSAVSRLRKSESMDEFFDDCVEQLRDICGYDRTMLYRFLPDWSGEILAESVATGMQKKYVGMRFPASDIPPQARLLYKTNTLRVLADVNAIADQLVPEFLPDGAKLDQSHSLLRSLSSAHHRYLRNMGVKATLVISLVFKGELWGMLTCHHDSPRVPPYGIREVMRSACELIANVVTMRIDDLMKVEQAQNVAEFGLLLSELSLLSRQKDDDLISALQEKLPDLQAAFHASVFGLQVGTHRYVSGVPSESEMQQRILEQVALVAAHLPPGGVARISDLPKRHPGLFQDLDKVAGLLVARLATTNDGICFMMRPEITQIVNWAGEPNKLVVVSEKDGPVLEPRRSFEVWKENVSGQAQPWSEIEVRSLKRLAAAFDEAWRSQQNRELQQQLHWRANHDVLTGLLNRSVVEQDLGQRITAPGAHVALFLIDIDHFKQINDTLGHEVGDKVLQEAARRFTACTRDNDMMVRMGGDEFLLVSELDEPVHEQAELIAARLHEAFAPKFHDEGWSQPVRISVGIAFSPKHGTDPTTLLRHADLALYDAKAKGRSRSVFYLPALESDMHDVVHLETQLHDAINGNELRLHYQPKVDLRTQKVIGMEALVRWQHPVRGLLFPDQFIPLAERNGMIGQLGRWVIGEAAAQLARWAHAGAARLSIAVNVSFVQIASGSLLADLREACDQHGIDPDLIEIELTETVVMENMGKSVGVLSDVAALGVKVALDDFGTGYSSLAYVQKLPLDYLKIDRSFVMNLQVDQQSEVVTRGVLGLSKGLNLKAIAEGVETLAQLNWLADHGCEMAQGYFLSRPVPPEDLPAAIIAIETATWKT